MKDFKRVYLCGPMSGLPEFNVPAFDLVANLLEGNGFSVVNPGTLSQNRSDLEWHDYMKWCLAELVRCDAVCLVGDWEDQSFEESEGVRDEVYIATRLGIPIFCLDGCSNLSRLKTYVWKSVVGLHGSDKNRPCIWDPIRYWSKQSF